MPRAPTEPNYWHPLENISISKDFTKSLQKLPVKYQAVSVYSMSENVEFKWLACRYSDNSFFSGLCPSIMRSEPFHSERISFLIDLH